MEICNLADEKKMSECVKKSAQVLRTGGVILFPTDTLYGLGADAFSDEAVEKIYAIKGRDEHKPIHAIASDIAMMEEYAEVPDVAHALAKEFIPGALTLILKKQDGVEAGIARGISTIGFRIPNNPFCLKLAKEFGKPFTATSANASGQKPERNVKAILQQLGGFSHSNILQNVRMREIMLVVDAGELPECQPSTVVDCSGKEPVILREGAIPPAEIWNLLGSEFQD
ncbi:MAG: L-threonylcarbamoyladenylate synthase [Candidatus Kaiserbacteria bacterium]|nr:L-threonylcarbamoyladenylate synthase [Candidatus Kaiserbacteria bacterium]